MVSHRQLTIECDIEVSDNEQTLYCGMLTDLTKVMNENKQQYFSLRTDTHSNFKMLVQFMTKERKYLVIRA